MSVRESRARMLGFLLLHLLYFPGMVGLIYVLHWGFQPVLGLLSPRMSRIVFTLLSLSLAGAAYVLPFRPSLAAQGSHRVYLKGMLVSESARNLVPEWAFFVKCVVDASQLRPNAVLRARRPRQTS